MSLSLRSAFPKNVFELMGKDENSATYALGWVLARSPVLATLFVEAIVGRPLDATGLRVALQRGGSHGGFTDIELWCDKGLHAIVEAKIGFELPDLKQLARYRPRLSGAKSSVVTLVSVSALPESIARRTLPKNIDTVPVKHLSWGAIRGLAKKAMGGCSGFEEKLWLRQLIDHLGAFAAMDRSIDNRVYVVSLSGEKMRAKGGRTWINVVEQDQRYFHPVGNGWPYQPPNYIGFRYRGELQSVHHIESFVIVKDVSTVNPTWERTEVDHFIYKLGPAMKPCKKLQAGGTHDSIKRSARVWCAIDTLLTGQFEQLGQARDATNSRMKAAENGDL